jgi:hypothetical protein
MRREGRRVQESQISNSFAFFKWSNAGDGAWMPGKVNVALLLANIVGAAIYLIASSYSWALPQERGLTSMTGEPFIWALGVLPIWALFFLLNLIWGAIITARPQWRSGRLWLVAGCIWLVSVAVDFAHY